MGRGVTCVFGCLDAFTARATSPGSAPASRGGRDASATKVIKKDLYANHTTPILWNQVVTLYSSHAPVDVASDIHVCSKEEPCQNGATCLIDDSGEYSCLCPDGFHGRNCELKTGPCLQRRQVILFNYTICMLEKVTCNIFSQVSCETLYLEHSIANSVIQMTTDLYVSQEDNIANVYVWRH